MGKCYFNPSWLKDDRFIEWLGQVHNNPDVFFCKVCKQTCSIGLNGIKALYSHAKSAKHCRALQSSKQSFSMFNFIKVQDASQPSTSASTAKNSITISNEECLTSGNTRSLDAFMSNEKTLMAEVRWVLHLVSTHSSCRSSDNISQLFSAMFHDSPIAQQFQCGRTKAGYLATFGLAPAILSDIMKIVKDAPFYSLMFDESFNKELQSKQMDVHLRFISNDIVQCKYMTSFFMGHAKAIDIERNIKEVVSNLGNRKLLQLSMDGPNVNLKVFKDISAELEREQIHQLINIGTCGLHVLHNAFKDGVKASEWDICSLLKSSFYIFQESPARREDYFTVTNSKILPLQFCGHRWLENASAAERLLLIWPQIIDYIKACKNGKTSEPMCKSFKIVTDFMADKMILVKLKSFINISKILKPFLEKYQTNDPLVPYLAQDMFEIVKRLYSFILKDDFLATLNMNSTLDPSKIENEKFRSHSEISLGFSADQELSERLKSKTLSERDVMAIHLDFQKMVKKIISKIVLKGPIAYKVARDITCLTPEMMKNKDAPAMFQSLAKYLHSRKWLKEEDVDEACYQFKNLRSHISIEGEMRLDEFFKRIPELAKMPALKNVIMMVLTLSHGNAEVERGFSVNKEVSVENMLEKTIVAHRLICQFVKDNGNPATVPLTKALLLSCSGSYQRYKMALDDQKKEKEKSVVVNTKKRKAEEVKEVASKKRKLELNIELLERKADELGDEAEKAGRAQKVHELIMQSNALRKDVKTKKLDLASLDASLQALQKELDSL